MQLSSFLNLFWWRQLLTRLFKKPSSSFITLYKNLDLRMVNHARSGGVPSWIQLRHIFEFFSPQEKKYLRILSLITVISLFVLLGNYIWTHHTIKPIQGGEYTEGIIGMPNLINPLFSSLNQVDADLAKIVYSGLFRFDEHLALQPELAERYEISKDNKTYRIFLKKNLKWSDDEPLTADDVGFTLERIQDNNTNSSLILLFQNVTFEKINDREFTLTLKDAYAPFINFLTTGLLPEHIWQEIMPTNTRLSTANLRPIGSGPYVIHSLAKDETGNIRSYTFTPNNNFVNGAPFIKNLTFKFFPNLSAAFDALKTRQIDGLGRTPLSELDKINTKTNSVLSLETNQYTALFFNPPEQSILKDKKIRAALMHAINRAALIQDVLGSHATPIDGPLLNSPLGLNQTMNNSKTFNIKESNRLLVDAGWKKISYEDKARAEQENQMNAWIKKNQQPSMPRRATAKQKAAFEEQFASWQKLKEEARTKIAKEQQKNPPPNQQFFLQKNNTLLSLTITTVRQDEFQKAAEIIADAWRAIGIDARIETIEPNRIRADILKDKKYDVLLYNVILANDADPYPLWHSSQIRSGGLNLSAFSNKQADDALTKARTTTSLEDRTALYEKFQTLLNEEIPAVFLYSPHYLYVIQSGIMGVPQMRLYSSDDRFNTINKWFIKTRWGFKR